MTLPSDAPQASAALDPKSAAGDTAAPLRDDRTYLTLAGGAALEGRWALSRRQLLAASIEGRVEWFRERDELGDGSSAAGWRGGGAVAVSDELVLGAGEELVLIPALRAGLADPLDALRQQ